jgi:folate-binding protein YgfZ
MVDLKRAAIDDALRDGAALLLRSDAGVLVLEGADRVDFLQRMSTNDIARLELGSACVTILTDAAAHILHVFTVVRQQDRLLVLPAPSDSAALERFLRGKIFFMDNVNVRNSGTEWVRMRVVGPHARTVSDTLGIELGEVDGACAESDGITAIWQERYEVPGVELVIPSARADAFVAQLQGLGLVVIDDPLQYELRRIELGRPAVGAELTAEFNPLEAGMAWVCAENKGCYTGQEILARQVTYDKVTRALVALKSSLQLTTGSRLHAEGRDVGSVTSSGWNQHTGEAMALAIVKRPYNIHGTALVVDGMGVEVVKLPHDVSAG